MKKIIIKLLSSILFLTLCANMVVPVMALSENVYENNIANDTTVDARLSEYTVVDMPLSLREAIMPDGSTNKTVSTINADDMYSVTIDNGDGTQTVNIFQNPIKYKSENGEIKFYTHALESTSASAFASTSDALYSYKNEEGAVKTYYSADIQSGVKLSYNNYNVTMAPLTDTTLFPDIAYLMSSDNQMPGASAVTVSNSQISTSTAKVTFSCDGNKIMYNNVIANGITYEYMPIANGIKENIVLTSYNNINTFHFAINIGNLQPDKMISHGEAIYLTDPDDSDADAIMISPIYAYDSAGGISFEHSMYLTKTDTDGKYILTVVADHDFLESPSTVYPVTIDPTITIYLEDESLISDTFISSNHPTSNYHLAVFAPVGNDVNYAESYAFFQLKNFEQYSYINPNSITLARLTLDCYYTTGTQDNPVQLYGYSNSNEVNISSLTWNNRPDKAGAAFGNADGTPVSIESTDYYIFYITDLVRDWMKYEYNDGGQSYLHSLRLEMINDTDDTHYATFRSTNWGSNFPCFSISYEKWETEGAIIDGEYYYIKNKNSGQYLTVADGLDSNSANVQQEKFTGTSEQKWQIYMTDDGEYRISPESSTTRVLDVYTANANNGTNIDISTDSNSPDRRFQILLNSDGYSYRILPLCGNGLTAVTVLDNSCQEGANVVQYEYTEGQYNSEWIFEPVYYYSKDLLLQYANNVWDSHCPAYPWFNGADCANFVSQCLLAGGIHFQGDWEIHKNNDKYMCPEYTWQINYSWELSSPSPWISAREFNNFWSARCTTDTFTGAYVASNTAEIRALGYDIGDVVQKLEAIENDNGETVPGNAEHTWVITDKYTVDGIVHYTLTAHTGDTNDTDLADICTKKSGNYFRFFSFNSLEQ